jgi:1-deoxy-D-xylulose-5-phosphate synthase
MVDNNYNANIKRLGIPDLFIEHGTPEQLHKICGYDSESILDTVVNLHHS